MKLLLFYLLYKIFINLVEGKEIDCQSDTSNVVISVDKKVKGPEFCDAEPGDKLTIICSLTKDSIGIDFNDDTMRWEVIKGNINNATISSNKDLQTSKYTVNITSGVKDVEVSCYCQDDSFDTSDSKIIIKLNHNEKRDKEKKIAEKLELKSFVVKLSIAFIILLILSIVSFGFCLSRCCRYRKLKSKEDRKKKLRLLLTKANITLSEMDEPKKSINKVDNGQSANKQQSKSLSKGTNANKTPNSVDVNYRV